MDNSKKRFVVLTTLLILIISLLYFYKPLFTDTIFQSGDASYVGYLEKNNYLEKNKIDFYRSHLLLGSGAGVYAAHLEYFLHILFSPKLTFVLSYLLPFLFIFMSFFLLFFQMSRHRITALISSLIAAFSPILFTYIYPGHQGKLQSLMFIPLAIFFINNFIKSKKFKESWISLLLASLTIGAAFLHSAVQTVFYLIVVIGLYVLYFLPGNIKEYTTTNFWKNNVKKMIFLTLIPIIIVVFSFTVIQTQWGNITGSAEDDFPAIEKSEKEDVQQKWYWATQWSFPPEEILDLFIPGIFGYFSGSTDAPYWGRTGRSHGWSADNPQSGLMQNLSLTSNYCGLFMILFAIIAIFFVRNRQMRFWSLIALISLLLSFGKHFPLYKLFYLIPYMDRFRNPNKFLHVFYIALSFLSFFGVKYFVCRIEDIISDTKLSEEKQTQRLKYFKRFILFTMLIAFLGWIIVLGNTQSLSYYFQKIYNFNIVKVIKSQISNSIFKFIVYFVIFSIVLFQGLNKKFKKYNYKIAVYILIIFLILFDQYRINKKYIVYQPAAGYRQKDQVVDFFLQQQQVNHGRIAILAQNNYLNYFFRIFVPVHQLEVFDYNAMRSMPLDLETYNAIMNRNSSKYFENIGVRYLLSSRPVMVLGTKPLFSFNIPNTPDNIYCYELTNALPRINIVHSFINSTNLKEISSSLNTSDLNNKVLLMNSEVDELKFSVAEGVSDMVSIKEFTPTYKKIEVRSAGNGMLVMADQFDNAWKAFIDGKPAVIYRVNYLLQGLYVPNGDHEIIVKYNPFDLFYYISLICWLLFIVLLFYYMYSKRKSFFI